ncbi:hypothetical protein [uncultured Pantoea sp.]|uniref:hypothetical protein n=1 Tax=uncultured Pantoea sp. TaxID=218084 RepID=UPI0025835B20|nr:hypothetical protein [uncultured Pantoea sp.]
MINLTHSEARRLIDKLHHNQTKEHGISILEEKYLKGMELALMVLEQPEGQFFLVEHHNSYEVETTLLAAMNRRAELGGRIWALTGSIVKPKTDTYRQIENDGWIEWKGDRALPPVEVDALVEVRLRGGEMIKREAKYFAWSNGVGNRSYDIIAYRVIESDGRKG